MYKNLLRQVNNWKLTRLWIVGEKEKKADVRKEKRKRKQK